MDEEILLAVEQIGGRLSRDCYCDLCCLVETAIPHLPGTFSMEALYAEARAESGKEKEYFSDLEDFDRSFRRWGCDLLSN